MSYILNSESRLFCVISEDLLDLCDSGDKPANKALTEAREACNIGDMNRATKAIQRADKRVDKMMGGN